MNYHNELIKISDFSKLCGVTKQTLIYYDKIGLFPPHFTNDKGYRFYTLDQYNLLGLIKTLKDLETPLEEIKTYINNKNSENFMELLKKKKVEVMERIENLESISQAIDTGIKSLNESWTNLPKVGKSMIEFQEEEYIHSVNFFDCSNFLNAIKSINELNKIAEILNIKMPAIHGIVKKGDLLEDNKAINVSELYIKGNRKNENSIVKSRGKYAVIYHRGTFEETYKSYQVLLPFIKEKGYKVKGDSYEETILDIKTEDKNIFLIKISIFIG